MDAQNAVESTSAKQPASPRRGSDNESTRPRNRSPVASKTAASTTIATSITVKELKPPPNASTNATDEDAAHERDSDAETIVLPGKDGISPSKPRKVIKHEDKSDGEIDDHVLPAPKKSSREAKDISHHGDRPVAADDAASSMRQKKRPLEKQRARDGSAGLSSAPTSPPTHLQREQSSSLRRRNHGNHDSGSDSETPKPRSPRLSKEKGTPLDRHLSHKRKAPKTESDDDAETRKIRRPRVSETGLEGRLSKEPKSASSKPHLERYSASRPRSISPHAHVRAHRRSLSTQLPDKSYASGFGPKKRRIPAPLQSTDYHSDDSSASGSPHPRSSRLKSIVTPGTGDSTMSPAKLAPHKKHLDAHGQTLFAKACAKGEYDVAKTRLAERPEDLNFADHAGNTPLQVASLNGHEDVVELLIGAGCNLECRNDVKDTPLLDAVENGHLGVVKLLLAAGVNPRKANAEGQEPLEKVPDDLDNAEEIRQALIEAKQKVGELRRTSEDHAPNDNQDTSSHGANSPRRSPEPSLGAVLAASSRRGGTVRSTKTSNHLLYMSLDEKTLRSAAARGDHETVTRILQVKESCDDAEALVAAARGGHNFVMELLLALGGANPDPSPVSSLPGEHSTPMLAAIGQENIKVVQLLLEQSGFDPTRRFRGETYYEIAKRREGPMWKEEEHMLKNAYDEYKKTHKGHVKNKVSPSRRERDMAGQDVKRAPRTENSTEKSRLQHKRRPSSPSREGDVKKKVNSAKTVSSPKEKKRSQSFGQNDEQVSPKRGRPKKEDKVPTIAISDREASPALSAKAHPVKPKRSESDMAGSSEGETAKPRRKLISGKDLKGQRDKQRRSSMVSNNSAKDAAERHDSKIEDSTEKPRAERITEKYHDRTKALKRDDSRDRLSPSDASSKRLRASMTPPRHSADDKDDNEAPVKRRKLDADGKENRGLKNPPAEDRPRKRDSSGEPIKRQKLADGDRKDVLKAKKLNRERKESEKASSEKPDSTTASEDVEMRDAPEAPSAEDREAALEKERAESKKRQAELEAAEEEARKKAEAIKQRELEEKQKREADEKRLQEEADKKRAEEDEKHRLEEAERKRKEEAQAKLEAERLKREEEAKKAREEEERLQKEKEDQRRRQEEERIRLEKEAAEEARRLREEEERRERERKRAARDAELLRQRQEQEREQERLRLSKLPPLLRWLNGCADPKQREYAQLFTIMQGVRYDTINPLATGAQGREQWLLNTQVALLLGEKDLSLQRYTGWEKIPVSSIAKRVIWRLEQDRYALTESKLYHLGEELPDYYGGDPSKVGYQRLEKLRRDASKLFFDMDMFFVKESDLLFVLPTIPHLRNVKLSICYRELPEHENQLNFWTAPAKWKSDPDANAREGFAPRQKYYINGRLDGEDRPGHYKPSTSPFPDQRVPRRGGLTAVGPEEPDYPQLCMEQGLGHLLSEHQKLMVMNAAHLTPRSMTSNDTADGPNGDNMSPSAASPTTRVNGNYERGSPEAPLVNGINGTAH